ncbi:phage head-tail connector protein [Acetivibrio cellulolyticus]|uniref:phage head-tail connector protein n=1 Tax=Acetivibrio cellulolyticus TaxID=35830 RepID=UPI0001E2C297|nr:phage head-tail connector protein [Acetivibrio cellulolyticus]
MLELLKQLIGITVEDTVLNFFIDKSKNSIRNYLNIDMTVEQEITYSNQIVDLALFLYKNKDHNGYKQWTQGGRAATLADSTSGIPESIKISLPLPFVKVCGSNVL